MVELFDQYQDKVFSRLDVVLFMTDILQPDLLYVSKERSEILAEKNVVAAPDLVVEIVSEGTLKTDRNAKKYLYEKHGVKEYWIVDPDEQNPNKKTGRVFAAVGD